MRKKELAVIRLWHEGNSFSPLRTGAREFRLREWVPSQEAHAYYRNTATEMGALCDFLDRNCDWHAQVLLAAAAPPGGPIEDELFEQLQLAVLEVGRRPYDAVYLSLHGAMVTESDPAPELKLLSMVRERIGGTPMAVTFDLHANLAPEIADLVDIALAYKTYPHIDMRDTAAKALCLLAATVAGRLRPRLALAKVPAILPSFNMRTDSGPMADAETLARRLEHERGLLDVSPMGGFAYGDTPHAGASVLALADADVGAARTAAEEVARFLWENRSRFRVQAPTPAEGVRKALAAPSGLVAVLDPSDNPMSGGIGDTPELFQALLNEAPRAPSVFAFFCDETLVCKARMAGEGGQLEAAFGGRLTDIYGPPVLAQARVRKLTDGRFVNRGPMEAGLPVALGATAVLGIGDWLQVIVTEGCHSPNDPAYFELHGIDLGRVRLLCAKAKNHFRAAFGPLCRAVIEVDAAGPAGFDLLKFPFRHAPQALVRAVAES
ncbi:MAG TPA: M81 family metallopeptidase [Alphaproteobacteria bacterium]|nr:M81 family metallopeptidase [Alphaproteobacteria bacterium]